jgi:hypothetical protein
VLEDGGRTGNFIQVMPDRSYGCGGTKAGTSEADALHEVPTGHRCVKIGHSIFPPSNISDMRPTTAVTRTPLWAMNNISDVTTNYYPPFDVFIMSIYLLGVILLYFLVFLSSYRMRIKIERPII